MEQAAILCQRNSAVGAARDGYVTSEALIASGKRSKAEVYVVFVEVHIPVLKHAVLKHLRQFLCRMNLL